ncbi:hypothetical protein [Flexistipes sinusarabici]|uniref:hypothetical protein n=1 Tax=Flexistipes sinusarabici TaxID=2352 RepID=UPI0006902CF9|nr:hypothetical protein [Flexistipes sinusarabici]
MLEVNDVACERLGYSREEILKLSVLDIDSPDIAHLAFKRIRIIQSSRNASNYREHATKVVIQKHRQEGDLHLNEKNIAVKGLLVRHLVMPQGTAGTEIL